MTNPCLLDANVLIAAYIKDNNQHFLAKSLLAQCQDYKLQTNRLVVEEVATVLLLLTKDLSFATNITDFLFFDEAAKVEVTVLSQKLWQESYGIFSKQWSNNLSLTDCSLIAQARLQEIKTIVTLDKDLKQEFKEEFNFIEPE